MSDVIIPDYHTHTPLCKHAEGAPEEYARRVVELGLAEYGVSDHAPALPEPFDNWRMEKAELPAYVQWVEEVRAATEGIPVRMGLECDWLKGCEGWIEELWGEYQWDYFIGSVHYLADKWDFDNPKWLGKWAEINVEEAWEEYWKTYAEMVRSKLFQIHGHPDLIKKFGFYPAGDLRRYYEPVIQALVDTGGSIELNTAGWHKPCQEQYPAVPFLEQCAEAGVSLIISSDAHAPAEVARDFPQAIELAKQCGFAETVLLQQGEKTLSPL